MVHKSRNYSDRYLICYLFTAVGEPTTPYSNHDSLAPCLFIYHRAVLPFDHEGPEVTPLLLAAKESHLEPRERSYFPLRRAINRRLCS